MKTLFSTLLATGLMACAPQNQTEPTTAKSQLANVAMVKTEGCLTGPIEQFGRYIGNWDIQTWTLSKTDGTTWEETAGAKWNFMCVGNGVAIQDFWMPDNGNVGTNLRMYDPKEKHWDIAWTATAAPGFSHIRAKEDENGHIVMHFVAPEQTPDRRITFMPPTENEWDWKLEMEFASGGEKQWNEVFRIKATRHQN